jgi:glycosyltransferase involved in cell wall biosynthesis
MPVDTAMLPQPIIGYVGNINYRIDMDLIKWLAEHNPTWSFVFVGSVKPDVDLARLSAYKNLYFLGHRPYNDLPGYLHHFDVCLIPYRPLREMGSPIKLYDYLACGKPVVTTNFAGVVGFSDVVYIAEYYDDFQEMVERAIGERQEEAECLAQARRKVAQLCSWDVRSEEVWNRIREVIERKDRMQ